MEMNEGNLREAISLQRRISEELEKRQGDTPDSRLAFYE